MSNRIYKNLAIVFLIFGFLLYDRYLVEQGQISPVMRVLDFVGLSKYVHWQGTAKSNNIRVQGKWNKCQQAWSVIDKARAEKIGERTKELEKLRRTNDEIYNVALGSAQEWQNVKREKTKEFLGVVTVGNSVIQASKEQSLAVRAEKFKKARAIFWTELTEALPDTDVQVLKVSLDQLEGIALETQPLPQNCASRPSCLESAIDDFVRTMTKLFENDLNQPMSLVSALADSTEILKREYQILADNLTANDKVVEGYDQNWYGALVVLTTLDQEAIPVKVRQLKKQYKKVVGECEKLLVNLQLNRERVRQALEQASHRTQKVKQVESSLNPEAKDLVGKIDHSFLQQQQGWQEFEKNEDAIAQLTRDWFQASGMLLDELSVDWKEEYTQQIQKTGVQR